MCLHLDMVQQLSSTLERTTVEGLLIIIRRHDTRRFTSTVMYDQTHALHTPSSRDSKVNPNLTHLLLGSPTTMIRLPPSPQVEASLAEESPVSGTIRESFAGLITSQ